MQPFWVDSSAAFAWLRSAVVACRSPSAAALDCPAAALSAFSSPKSLVSVAFRSSRACFSKAKWCCAPTSDFRSSLKWPSALSFKSSNTFKMPLLCVVYTAAAGAPASSPSSSSACCDWTKASNLPLSATEIAVASTSTLRDCRALCILLPPTCTSASGFFLTSSAMMSMARPRVSITLSSSLSPLTKSAASRFRIWVAFVSSPVVAAIAATRSSTFESATSICELRSVILASSFSFWAVASLISKPFCFETSAHHFEYSS
mmetsp:Transcript_116942/g.330905  ORF Transcript_116942/g.330905 Transcript_116942/m.330905 type:complete len:261 (+) Transcript_116942:243-1025(+)